MSRTPLLAGNWKMHGTRSEAQALAGALAKSVGRVRGREVVLAPPYTALDTVSQAIAGTSIKLAAQNCYWEPKGAFTGEISAVMLQEAGCAYVIVGHSERRQLFGETDEMVAKKVRSVLAAEMRPILCVGESLDEREAGGTQTKVTGQLRAALQGVTLEDPESLVIAYEPIWAIGTGRNAEPTDAGEVAALIRGTVGELVSADAASGIRIQYGGSVKPGNIRDFMAHPEIDGALVGGASLDPEDFALIVKYR